MIRLVTAALCALLSLGADALAAEVYKWTDDAGVLQYTQAPPEGREFQVVKQRRYQAAASSTKTASAAAGASPQVDADAQITTAEAGTVQEAKQRNCEIARKNIEVLSTKTTILMTDPETGENRRLSEEERQAQLRQAERDAGYFCE